MAGDGGAGRTASCRQLPAALTRPTADVSATRLLLCPGRPGQGSGATHISTARGIPEAIPSSIRIFPRINRFPDKFFPSLAEPPRVSRRGQRSLQTIISRLLGDTAARTSSGAAGRARSSPGGAAGSGDMRQTRPGYRWAGGTLAAVHSLRIFLQFFVSVPSRAAPYAGSV